MARRWFEEGSSMARRRLVKVIGFLRPCKSATLRSHYPSPKAVPTSLCPSSTQAPELGYTLGRAWLRYAALLVEVIGYAALLVEVIGYAALLVEVIGYAASLVEELYTIHFKNALTVHAC